MPNEKGFPKISSFISESEMSGNFCSAYSKISNTMDSSEKTEEAKVGSEVTEFREVEISGETEGSLKALTLGKKKNRKRLPPSIRFRVEKKEFMAISPPLKKTMNWTGNRNLRAKNVRTARRKRLTFSIAPIFPAKTAFQNGISKNSTIPSFAQSSKDLGVRALRVFLSASIQAERMT